MKLFFKPEKTWNEKNMWSRSSGSKAYQFLSCFILTQFLDRIVPLHHQSTSLGVPEPMLRSSLNLSSLDWWSGVGGKALFFFDILCPVFWSTTRLHAILHPQMTVTHRSDSGPRTRALHIPLPQDKLKTKPMDTPCWDLLDAKHIWANTWHCTQQTCHLEQNICHTMTIWRPKLFEQSKILKTNLPTCPRTSSWHQAIHFKGFKPIF